MGSKPAIGTAPGVGLGAIAFLAGGAVSSWLLLVAWDWTRIPASAGLRTIPLIETPEEPAKRIPPERGGHSVSFKDLEVYSILDGDTSPDAWRQAEAMQAEPTGLPEEGAEWARSPQANDGKQEAVASRTEAEMALPVPRPERRDL
jgi:hypothetical protein